MDLSDYCRTIETHLCRKNDGHLIRIAGPSFDVVARWAADGIPVKVAVGGIDRYFERYYRKGPRRRPVKIDFCDNDVRDLFDEWRRATGVTAGAAAAPPDAASQAGDATAEPVRRRGPSLPEHLERVLTRLSSLRVTGVLGDAADPIVDGLGPAATVVGHAYYWDEGIGAFVGGPGRAGASWLSRVLDAKIIDGAVNGTGWLVAWKARMLSRLQDGYVRRYGLAILLGATAVLLFLVMWAGR